jgi:pyruvate dehydrogenase E2 component (dihydrolipoamide acetyltransferase)
MPYVFELPEVGEGVVEAEVVSWNVREGDVVQVDQPLCEITTDKAQLEISSPKSGRIVRLHGKPGDIIKVHAPLCEIDTDAVGQPAQPAAQAPAKAATTTPPHALAPKAQPEPQRHHQPPNGQGLTNGQLGPPTASKALAPAASAPPVPGETRAAPAVRREAHKMGLDIHQVQGSGPGGRVTRDDLQTASAQPREAPAEQPLPKVAPALPQVLPTGAEERIKLIGIRRRIAEQMRKSKHTAAHFTYVEEVDCGELVELRNRLKKIAADQGVKLTYIPILMKATSLVLREFPNINAVMDEESFELVVKGDHNIGLSTDTPQGLYVPVVRNVEQKSILQLAIELDDLVARTRAGKAKLDELRGGTFTMTSVGSIGGVLATPILNVPEVAILGVNAIRDQAVVRDGQIVVRPMMFLSPSFDHRVIDGAMGARFVAALKDVIEHPEKLLLELR